MCSVQPRLDLGRLDPGAHKQHRGHRVRTPGSDDALVARASNKIFEPITRFGDERCVSNPARTHLLICDCGRD